MQRSYALPRPARLALLYRTACVPKANSCDRRRLGLPRCVVAVALRWHCGGTSGGSSRPTCPSPPPSGPACSASGVARCGGCKDAATPPDSLGLHCPPSAQCSMHRACTLACRYRPAASVGQYAQARQHSTICTCNKGATLRPPTKTYLQSFNMPDTPLLRAPVEQPGRAGRVTRLCRRVSTRLEACWRPGVCWSRGRGRDSSGGVPVQPA